MASILKDILIEAHPDEVWDALRDWGALHRRLAPGFVADTRLDGEDRIVTFASGLVVREVLVDLDDKRRRLVWSVVDGPYTHHNGVAQVYPEGRHTRFVWAADLLPNACAATTARAMEEGLTAIKHSLDAGRGLA
jgi:Polyketide cyclase / dehydrase and lipid transport